MPAFGFSSHVISDLSEYDAEVILSLAIMRPTRGDPQSDTQDDTQGDTQGGTQSGTQEENLDKWVENQIRENPQISTEELSKMSKKGIATIKRHIAKMPHIRYVGSGYSGHWEVDAY